MQQVLNSQERNQAFLKFLVFFLITVVLVVLAVFFNYRLPFRENKMLQSEVDVQRVQEVNQQKFVARMQEFIVLLDSLEKKNTNISQIDMQLNSKYGELSIFKDNSMYGQMNKMIVDKLGDLQQLKRALRETRDNVNRLSAVQTDLDKCQAENLQLHGQLDGLRKGSGF